MIAGPKQKHSCILVPRLRYVSFAPTVDTVIVGPKQKSIDLAKPCQDGSLGWLYFYLGLLLTKSSRSGQDVPGGWLGRHVT